MVDGPGQPSLTDAFASHDSVEVASFVIISDVVREMFRFPNQAKNKSVSVRMSIDVTARTFEVRAEGSYGVAKSVIPFSQSDFQKVNIDLQENFSALYSAVSLTPVLNAMSLSFETKFKFKSNGMVAIQQGIRGASMSGIETVVEFILQPVEDDTGI
jgi:cell cycle checkpoint protein